MVTNESNQQFTSPRKPEPIVRLRSAIVRALLFALIWWILTDGASGSWVVGLPMVLLATFASLALLQPFRVSLMGIMRFIPFFIWHSLQGGVDVAQRVLRPKMLISPTLFDYKVTLPAGISRVFMANTVSLLPGTLNAELDQDILRVHVLDEADNFEEELNILEKQVASVFGLELS